jgi:hypothetical protein
MRGQMAIIAIAFVVVGCGSSGAPAAAQTAATGKIAAACVEQLSDLTNALTDLDSRLSVGMSFAAYGEKVGDVRVAYDRVPFDKLDADCVAGLGKPDEDAFNAYIRAYNIWNDCIKDTACKTAGIETKLQAEWSGATAILAGVKNRLP